MSSHDLNQRAWAVQLAACLRGPGRRGAALLVPALVPALLLGAWPGSASASTWSVPLAVGSKGQARARTVPTAPTGVAASCASATTVTVSWTAPAAGAAAPASSYTLSQSTTTAGGTYTTVASGLAGTSWTSGTLTAGNYWYKVRAVSGTTWTGTLSTNTSQRTIASGGGCT